MKPVTYFTTTQRVITQQSSEVPFDAVYESTTPKSTTTPTIQSTTKKVPAGIIHIPDFPTFTLVEVPAPNNVKLNNTGNVFLSFIFLLTQTNI